MSPPTQYRLSGRQFYRSKDPTNSIKVLKEKDATKTKENPEKGNKKYSRTKLAWFCCLIRPSAVKRGGLIQRSWAHMGLTVHLFTADPTLTCSPVRALICCCIASCSCAWRSKSSACVRCCCSAARLCLDSASSVLSSWHLRCSSAKLYTQHRRLWHSVQYKPDLIKYNKHFVVGGPAIMCMSLHQLLLLLLTIRLMWRLVQKPQGHVTYKKKRKNDVFGRQRKTGGRAEVRAISTTLRTSTSLNIAWKSTVTTLTWQTTVSCSKRRQQQQEKRIRYDTTPVQAVLWPTKSDY